MSDSVAEDQGPMDSFILARTSAVVALLRQDIASSLPLEQLAALLSSSKSGSVGVAASSNGPRIGRAAVSRIEVDGRSLIVRHFRRGGLVAKFNSDTFLRLPPWSSFRMFAELKVLSALSLQGACVPRPVGAIVQPMVRAGNAALYRGLLITEELSGTKNLLAEAANGSAAGLPIEELCRRAGVEARRCLTLGVFHPDLHPGNVLFDAAGKTYIIDFDQARLNYDRPLREPWQRRTVARWNRSIDKHSLPPQLRTAFFDGLYAAS